MKTAAAQLPREKVAALDAQAGVGRYIYKASRCEVNRKKSKFERDGLLTTIIALSGSQSLDFGL